MTHDALIDGVESAMAHGEPAEAAAVLAAALRGLSDRGREVADALATLSDKDGLVTWQLEEAIAQLEDVKLKA